MTTNPSKQQVSKPNRSVIRWLLDSDPSIRWQVIRDLIDAPANEVAAERARVAAFFEGEVEPCCSCVENSGFGEVDRIYRKLPTIQLLHQPTTLWHNSPHAMATISSDGSRPAPL